MLANMPLAFPFEFSAIEWVDQNVFDAALTKDLGTICRHQIFLADLVSDRIIGKPFQGSKLKNSLYNFLCGIIGNNLGLLATILSFTAFSNIFVTPWRMTRKPAIPSLFCHPFLRFSGNVERDVLAHRCHHVVGEDVSRTAVTIKHSAIFVIVNDKSSSHHKKLQLLTIGKIASQAVRLFDNQMQDLAFARGNVLTNVVHHAVKFFPLVRFATCLNEAKNPHEVKAVALAVLFSEALLRIQRITVILF
ncbi:MAG TPA: hypothetical protein VN132_15980 [Bdellovibrio sp.]|nr:hypothetical protein [Bdellovibrio sp.]